MAGDTHAAAHYDFATNGYHDERHLDTISNTHGDNEKTKGDDVFYACGNGATTVSVDINGSEHFVLSADARSASVETLATVPKISAPAGEPFYPSMVTLGQDSPEKEVTSPKPRGRRR